MTNKQESWEVEFDLLFPACTGKFGSFGSSVEGWIAFGNKQKQFIRETLQKERERVVGILEALPVGLSEEYIGNHSIVRCVDINRVIALITKEV